MKKKRKARPLRKKVKIKKSLMASKDETGTVNQSDINSQKSQSTQPVSPKEVQLPNKKTEKEFETLYTELKKHYEFLMADFANYKRQTIKQQVLSKKYEGQFFITNLLNKVMDDFDRAMNAELTEQTTETFKQGISLIYKNLKYLLKEFHIKKVPCLGKPFNPSVHSAINSVATDDIAPEHIVDVLKEAYFLHDKLLRPAEVIVSRQNTSEIKNNNKESDDE